MGVLPTVVLCSAARGNICKLRVCYQKLHTNIGSYVYRLFRVLHVGLTNLSVLSDVAFRLKRSNVSALEVRLG
jgi:hypothetical protein